MSAEPYKKKNLQQFYRYKNWNDDDEDENFSSWKKIYI